MKNDEGDPCLQAIRECILFLGILFCGVGASAILRVVGCTGG